MKEHDCITIPLKYVRAIWAVILLLVSLTAMVIKVYYQNDSDMRELRNVVTTDHRAIVTTAKECCSDAGYRKVSEIFMSAAQAGESR